MNLSLLRIYGYTTVYADTVLGARPLPVKHDLCLTWSSIAVVVMPPAHTATASPGSVALEVLAAISSIKRGHSAGGMWCPIPGTITSRAPGMAAAVARPPEAIISRS
jgi:hypothetical protein